MKVLLVSTYELGRQPFGLASAAAWLSEGGHEVLCADLAVGSLPQEAVRAAGFVAFFLPMHTATRLAARAIERVRNLNPRARLGCFGLYAALNETYLRSLGVEVLIGGEFEPALVAAAEGAGGTTVSTERQSFLVPDRSLLPPLEEYAHLHVQGAVKTVGYTEASRGCKHLCRHCPVVPVYGGKFRIVAAEVVLEDVRRQVAAGAEHITFGDPDFFNGPGHALRIVRALAAEHCGRLTYDVTIKVEHLCAHSELLPVLRETGCLFVTTAVESIEDEVLARLEKGHTRADFEAAARACREAGLTLAPTFIPFTPWTTRAGYRELLRTLVELGLVDHVAPVQLGLRLLITAGSRLLELGEIQARIGEFDAAALVYPWRHPEAALDELSARILELAAAGQRAGASRREIFAEVWRLVSDERLPENFDLMPRVTVPYLDEPWYC